jgi:amino acid permease
MATKTPFTETYAYKVWLSPLIHVGFSLVGDTMPLWGSLLVSLVFVGILPDGAWPGLSFFIIDGTIIVISFAFLSNTMYYSTRDKKYNFFNVFASILILASISLFTRAIGLKVSYSTHPSGGHVNDDLVKYGSWGIFIVSFLLYYFYLVRKKYKEEKSNVPQERLKDQNNLEQDFRTNKA